MSALFRLWRALKWMRLQRSSMAVHSLTWEPRPLFFPGSSPVSASERRLLPVRQPSRRSISPHRIPPVPAQTDSFRRFPALPRRPGSIRSKSSAPPPADSLLEVPPGICPTAEPGLLVLLKSLACPRQFSLFPSNIKFPPGFRIRLRGESPRTGTFRRPNIKPVSPRLRPEFCDVHASLGRKTNRCVPLRPYGTHSQVDSQFG